MTISLIIPTYNGSSRIRRTLNSISEKIKEQLFEIIVVNDGSTDDTEHVLKEYNWIKVTDKQNGGRAEARNSGAEQATGDILWFLDDDMKLGIDSLENIFDHFDQNRDSILVGMPIEDKDDCITDFQKYKRHLSLLWQKDFSTVG